MEVKFYVSELEVFQGQNGKVVIRFWGCLFPLHDFTLFLRKSYTWTQTIQLLRHLILQLLSLLYAGKSSPKYWWAPEIASRPKKVEINRSLQLTFKNHRFGSRGCYRIKMRWQPNENALRTTEDYVNARLMKHFHIHLISVLTGLMWDSDLLRLFRCAKSWFLFYLLNWVLWEDETK